MDRLYTSIGEKKIRLLTEDQRVSWGYLKTSGLLRVVVWRWGPAEIRADSAEFKGWACR